VHCANHADSQDALTRNRELRVAVGLFSGKVQSRSVNATGARAINLLKSSSIWQ
jgi:hypothetical protein